MADPAQMTPPRSQDNMSESANNDSELELSTKGFSPNSCASPAFEQWQSQTGLNTFGESLNIAAKAVFPTEARYRYLKVYVLMLYWKGEDQSQTAPIETSQLFGVFKDTFNFEVSKFSIPSEKSQQAVEKEIEDFVQLGGNRNEHLKIVHYAGGAKANKAGRVVWTK